MKQKICEAIFIISILLAVVIVAGIESGWSLLTGLWCIPLACTAFISIFVGGLYK
jgi:hypothetical protein